MLKFSKSFLIKIQTKQKIPVVNQKVKTEKAYVLSIVKRDPQHFKRVIRIRWSEESIEKFLNIFIVVLEMHFGEM